MKIEFNSNDDRKKMLEWLNLVSNTSGKDIELDRLISRINREIEYYDNFNSQEFFEYTRKNEEENSSNCCIPEPSDESISKILNDIELEKEKINKDIKCKFPEAVSWIINNGCCSINSDQLSFRHTESFNGPCNELRLLLSTVANYLCYFVKDKSRYKLLKDEVDDWYFNLRGTDKNFVKPSCDFPDEAYLLKYAGHYWIYEAAYGQGTYCVLQIITEENRDRILAEYGVLNEDLDKLVCDLDKLD